jgi:RimJ/RimL family protein N-acetyltransferase
MPYYARVPGERCYLSPIDPDDAPIYAEWLNDPELALLTQIVPRIISLPAEREWLEKFSKDPHQFAIVDSASNELIGGCGLKDVDLVNRTALMGIFLGNKEYWGRGYGEEATRLLVDFAFSLVNLRSVMLEVFEFNPRAIRCYEKVGFKHVGRRRCAKLIGGECYDELLMDILAEEFESTLVKGIRAPGPQQPRPEGHQRSES